MNLTLHKLGQKLFSEATIDVLAVLKSHFGTITELELETCINGSIYCLMSVSHLKERANKMGLRQMLQDRLNTCTNEQVETQIRHIFAKMDEPENKDAWLRKQQLLMAGEQEQVLDEINEEDDEDYDENNIND